MPITEEGSGVKKADYILTPENGSAIAGEAEIIGEGENLVTGTAASADAGGQTAAQITIEEDFKGTISLKSVDNAGNESAGRTLTADGGGVIVEDYAPEIRFSAGKEENGSVSVHVSVKDDVDSSDRNHITGGIAQIDYQVDDKSKTAVTEKDFAGSIVPFCEFRVDISGAGEHVLKVSAADNAGNESRQEYKVNIAKKSALKKTFPDIKTSKTYRAAGNGVTVLPGVETLPVSVSASAEREPNTGDTSPDVEVYATIAMIAGLSYLLLYFTTGKNGMLEEEKNRIVAKWILWAKSGRRYRRFLALMIIFLLLFYYHSIGKHAEVRWEEI